MRTIIVNKEKELFLISVEKKNVGEMERLNRLVIAVEVDVGVRFDRSSGEVKACRWKRAAYRVQVKRSDREVESGGLKVVLET